MRKSKETLVKGFVSVYHCAPDNRKMFSVDNLGVDILNVKIHVQSI